MAREIERKFLVEGEAWKRDAERKQRIVQAYLGTGGKASVRVRIIDDAEARLTVKNREAGLSRDEFEYAIPVADARELTKLAKGMVIEKERHDVRFGGRLWEVDVYAGALRGLVVAECELDSEPDAIELPPWIGREVSRDPRFANEQLSASGMPPGDATGRAAI